MPVNRISTFDSEDTFFEQAWARVQRHTWSDAESDHDAALIVQYLGLEPGASILDIPCGDGRLAVRLARYGFRVTGLDVGSTWVESAAQSAHALNVHADFVRGDMRSIAWLQEFDASICFWTSLGYFQESENELVIERLHAALKPSGKLLIHTLCLESLVGRELNDQRTPVRRALEIEGWSIIEERYYEPLTGRLQYRAVHTKDGAVERSEFSFRVYSCAELAALLRRCGFTIKGLYASGVLRPFDIGDRYLVVVGQKAGTTK